MAGIKTWSNKSQNRMILFTAVVVAVSTLVVKAIAFAKDLLVAHNFGVSADLDAFLLAFMLPQFVGLTITTAFHTSLVPAYVETQQKSGPEQAQELLSAVFGRVLLILALTTVALAVIGPLILPMITRDFDPAHFNLTVFLFFLTLPTLFIQGITAFWNAVINAQNKYALAALAPMAVPLATIALIVLPRNTLGVYALAFGLLVGFSIQAVASVYQLKRLGIRIRPQWHVQASELRHTVAVVFQQFLPAAASTLIATSNEVIDQSMAASLGEGGVAALNYGVKIFVFAATVGTTGLGISFLTHFSTMVAEKRWQDVRHTYTVYARLIAAVTLPIILLVVALSPSIIELVFERGAFTSNDTFVVSQIQSAYFLQLPFLFLIILTQRLLSALKMQAVFLWGAPINVVANIVLNLVFSRLFGIAGIALATTAVMGISFLFLYVSARRGLKQAEEREA